MTEFKPGMRVRIADRGYSQSLSGLEAVVQDPAYAPLTGRVRVKPDVEGGYTAGVRPEDLTVVTYPPIATVTEQYPVGCTVRDTKYGNYGTVVEHRATNPANLADVGITVVVHFHDTPNSNATVPFPSPEERLERVHILTHEELTLLDEAVPMTGTANQPANAVLDAHLRPTVTRTFEVTVEQPADRPEVTVAGLTQVIAGHRGLHQSATVRVTEKNS